MKVLAFPQTTISAPPPSEQTYHTLATAEPLSNIKAYKLGNDGLKHLGFSADDVVFCRESTTWKDLEKMQLCVFELPDGRTSAYCAFTDKNKVFLFSEFGTMPEIYNKKDVKIIGLVICFQRNFADL